MSFGSSLDIGDPLGDRFWLSPKKGEWRLDYGTVLKHGGLAQRKSGCHYWSDERLCHEEVWSRTGQQLYNNCTAEQRVDHFTEPSYATISEGLFFVSLPLQLLSSVIHLLHAYSKFWLQFS